MKKKQPRLTASGKRVGRPPRLGGETIVLSMRLPVDVVEALDRYRDILAKDAPGFGVGRNDTIRRLLVVGLQREGIIEAPT